MASQGRRIPMIVGAALLACGAVVAILAGPHRGPEEGAADRALPAGASPRLVDTTSNENGSEGGSETDSSRELLAKPAPVADAGSALTVRVSDVFTHQPVPGVEVEFEGVDGSTFGDTQETDAQGRAILGPVPDVLGGGVVVHVRCPQGWPRELRIPVAPSPTIAGRRRDVEVEIRAPRTVCGTVVDAQGHPVAGAEVEGKRAVTDDAGRFQLGDVEAGEARIRASRADLGEGSALLSPGLPEVRIVIASPAPRPMIRILGPAGQEPRVVALIWEEPGVRWEAVVVARARAFLEGRVHRDGEQWDPQAWTSDAWLSVCAPGGSSGAPAAWGEAFIGPIRPGTESVEVRLEGARTLEGRVLDPAGQPVPGAGVVARAGESAWERLHSGAEHGTSSDSQGRFVIDGLGAGRYRVQVESGRGYTQSDEILVEAGSKGLELRVGTGADADVFVFDAEGWPIHGARVTFLFDDPAPGSPDSVSSSTDCLGFAPLFGLSPSSRGTLVIDPPEGGTSLRHTELGWTPRVTTISLLPTYAVRGTVTSPQGVPLAGVTVAARGGGATFRTISATSRGRFELRGFPAGPVEVWAYFGDLQGGVGEAGPLPWMSRVRAKAGDAEVRLEVEPGRELTVLVPQLAEASGDPVAALFPGTRFDPDGRILLSRSGQDGLFVFQGLAPGANYTLWAHAAGPSRSTLVSDLTAGPPVTVSLSSSVTLRGRLQGAPELRNGAVVAHLGPLRPVAYVAPDGTFEFSGLPPGTYDLEATGSVPDHGDWTGSARATVGTPVEIPMRHTAGPR